MRQDSNSQNIAFRTELAPWGWLCFCAVVVIVSVWGIWGGSLEAWDEGLTAQRSLEMFRHGLSMTVRTFEDPDFNKPPLYYWMVTAGFSLFGIGEFAVRLPSALMGLACMVLVYRLAKSCAADSRAGLLAVFLLVVTSHWLNISRQGLLDSGLTLSMLLALWFYVAFPRALSGAILAGFALALGFWMKNPSTVLILPAMFAYSRMAEKPDYWRPLLVLLVAGILGSVWYVHQFFIWGDRFSSFYVDYNLVKRFTENFEGHNSPWNYYLYQTFKQAPHVLLITSLAIGACLLRIYRPSRVAIVCFVFILTWIIVIHFIHSKRSSYLMPIYPFFAIFGGNFLVQMWDKIKNTNKSRTVLSVFFVLCILSFISEYDFNLEFNAGLKKATEFSSQNCKNSSVYVLNTNRHMASFYMGSIVDTFENATANLPGGFACVIYSSKNGVPNPLALSTATRIWDGDKNYSVWRVSGHQLGIAAKHGEIK